MTYKLSSPLTPEGFFKEQWLKQESYEKQCECMYQGSKKHRRARLDALDAYKLDKGCADCGYKEHAAALDFDHRPGTKKSFTIGHASSKKELWDKVWDEVAKCDVVCANCHRVRTYVKRAGSHNPRKDRSA